MTFFRVTRPSISLRTIVRAACAVATGVATLAAAQACGEDEAIVRPRLDSGIVDASNDGSTLPCGVSLPTVYASAEFATNASAELALAELFYQLDAKLQTTTLPDPDAGADGGTAVTSADLKNLYSSGTPSLRGASAGDTQTAVDGYFDAFGVALGKTWAPTDAEQDGGALSGGLYGSSLVSPIGLDLRESVLKRLLQGAFYNRALEILSTPVSAVSIDRLLAVFGATMSFAHRPDEQAGPLRDRLIAEYAANRDDMQSTPLGPYRKVREALLTLKVTVAAGDACKTEHDAAISTYLRQWEKAVFGSAIYYLNEAAATIAADPSKGPEAMHSFSTALGFIESFRGVPEAKRKISNIQIDALTTKIGAATPWKLVTSVGERAPKLTEAISDIKLFEELTDSEVEAFKKKF